jgi:hypothetical protein
VLLKEDFSLPLQDKPQKILPPALQQTATEISKVSFNWAKLIARIYEVNPLLCTSCGKEMKIRVIITDKTLIWRILKGIGWPTAAPEFDPPEDFSKWEICQLIPGSADGFPIVDEPCHFKSGSDPPHYEDCIDPPHWEDPNHIVYD